MQSRARRLLNSVTEDSFPREQAPNHDAEAEANAIDRIARGVVDDVVGLDSASCVANTRFGEIEIVVRGKGKGDVKEWRELGDEIIKELDKAGYPGFGIATLSSTGFIIDKNG